MRLKSYIDREKGKSITTYGKKRKSVSKTLTFVLIILFSASFWFVNYVQSKMQITIRIPIDYEIIKTKYQPKQNLPKYITVEVKDKWINLLRTKKNVSYMAKEQKAGNSYKLTFDERTIKDFVAKCLPSSSEIISVSPTKLEIPIVLKYSKKIPIKSDLDIQLRNGYTVCDTKLSQESIIIYGDKEILDGIDSAKLSLPIKKDIHHNIDSYAKVILPNGVTTSTDSIKVNANIEIISQMDITLPITIVGVPSNIEFHTLPSNAKVSISMPISKLKELKNNKDFPIESQIVIGIIYSEEFSLSGNNSIVVKFIEKPKWIMDYTITPSKVQYIIEKLNG